MIRVKSLFALTVLLVSLVAASPTVRADELFWDGLIGLDISRDGIFSDAGNWDMPAAAPPGVGDNANFDVADTYTVTFTQNEASDQLDVTAGNVTFVSDTADVRTYSISTGAADANISGGNLTIGQIGAPVSLNLNDPFASALQIGNGASGNVFVEGAGSALNAGGFPTHVIGNGASGGLTVRDGATAEIGIVGTLHVGVSASDTTSGSIQVQTGGTLSIGDTLVATNTSNAAGGIEVFTGSSVSQLTAIDATLEIGSSTGGNGAVFVHGGSYDSGTGQTTVNNTGTVFVELGGTFNANGPFAMDSGSTLLLQGGFFTANSGFDNSAEGTIDVNNSTLAVTAGAFVPNAGGATDDFAVDGSSGGMFHLVISDTATANIGRDLYIGDNGDGELTVDGGGMVSSRSGFLGNVASAMGTATIDGMGSDWTLVEQLDVGIEGTGELTIQNGGVVENNLGRIATEAGSVGTVVVDGMNSTWTNDINLVIAIKGTGSLTIQNQGTVESGLGKTSINPGSQADIVVHDAGSSWTINDDLILAQGGTGTLEILAGGLVTTTVEAFVANGSMSDGTVLVDGEGSTWNNLGNLTTGRFGGSATITIQNAGSIDNVNAFLSNDAIAVTDVTVDGTDSSWRSTGSLYVGGNDVAVGGTASFAAQNEGNVQVDGTLKIWNTGTVIIDSGSIVTQSLDNTDNGTLNFHNGTLTIDGGSLLPNPGGPADDFDLDGALPIDVPHLILTGGATATIGDVFRVGLNNQAELTVSDGTVSNVSGSIGSQATGVGRATIEGPSSSWTMTGNLFVGAFGDGTLVIQNGGKVSNAIGEVGDFGGSTGLVTVTGTGSLWMNDGDMIVGDDGSGTLNISDNGHVSAAGRITVGDGLMGTLTVDTGGSLEVDNAIVANEGGSTGSVTIDAATWTVTDFIIVGNNGTGTLTIRNGANVTSEDGFFGGQSVDSEGTGMVTGASTWTMTQEVEVGISGAGSLAIENGGSVYSVGGNIAVNALSTGDVTVRDAGSTWSSSADLFVGGNNFSAGGSGSMTVDNQGLVEAGGLFKVWETGTVTINGGTIAFETLDIMPGANFNFNFGTLNYTEDLTVAAGDLLETILGGSHAMAIGQELRVDGTTTLQTELSIVGGTFSTGNLANPHFLAFDTGTFNLTEADLIIGQGGLFGPSYVLGASRQFNVVNTTTIDAGALLVVEDGGSFSAGTLNNNGELTLGGAKAFAGGATINNSGLIRGTGRVIGPVSNSGVIEAIDQVGELIFNGAVTNETGGLIAVRASAVRFSQGITNDGQLSFGPGNSDLLGNVTNDDTIGLAGDATVSIIGDVVQNATLNLLSNSRLIVFDDFSGPGGTTGPGTLEVLGTLSPGASPAEVEFGGNLILGTNTLIELSGTDTGEFDRLVVEGQISLDGTLGVLLLDGFSPSLGDTFEIVAANGEISGKFAATSFPDVGTFLGMDVFYDTNTVTLAVVPALTGDHNGDGTVDAADYALWRSDPSSYGGSQGYTDWVNHFGQTLGSGSGTSMPVPEPAGVLLLLLGAAFGICRWRRNASWMPTTPNA